METISILNEKRKLGLLYGLFAGAALTLALWGKDAFLLWRAHAALAWIRLLVGGALSVAVFAFAGWLTMRCENTFLSIFIWLTSALVPSYLVVWMTYDGWRFLLSIFTPALVERFRAPTENYLLLTSLAALFFSIGAMLAGILEYPLLEQATFSSASGRMIAPLLIVVVIFIVVGSAADGSFHAKSRDSILSLDRTIQFIITHDLATVDQATARAMRVSALRAAGDSVKEPYRLSIASFDLPNEQVDLWANFNESWALCNTISAQVVNCRIEP